jgi:RNA polymerase sigma-70 factor, ECF subfamily
MLGHDADALDATQDALLAAVRGIARFDGRSAFGTWLYRIATNACIDELRRRRRRPVLGRGRDVAELARTADRSDGSRRRRDTEPRITLRAAASAPTAPSAPTAASTSVGTPALAPSSPSDTAERVVARIDVDRALDALPVEFRSAVVLRDLCDLPYDEIAVILSIPVGTVRSRIARGRAALADLLEDTGLGNRVDDRVVQPEGPPQQERSR